MKTADLSGPALDYWVAKAEGFDAEIITDEKGAFCVRTERFENGGKARGPYSPSTEWHRGGPIIERELICVSFGSNQESFPGWSALIGPEHYGDEGDASGSSPLIAAMRAYVIAKFGPEVEDILAPK